MVWVKMVCRSSFDPGNSVKDILFPLHCTTYQASFPPYLMKSAFNLVIYAKGLIHPLFAEPGMKWYEKVYMKSYMKTL